MIYGNWLATMDLRTGAPTFGTPEANLATYAVGQLARRLGVPLRLGGQYTASKIADGQAMQESADVMNSAILSGANLLLQAAGWLESGMTAGYEKFVMDLDHCGQIARMMEGLTLDENQLGTEAFRQAGAGENFLAVGHTQRNFETANYISPLVDTGPFEHWAEKGREDIQVRANRHWKEMLAGFEAPAFDPGVDEALTDFVARPKWKMPDEWY